MSEKVCHGSNIEVAKPRIIQNGFYKDLNRLTFPRMTEETEVYVK